MTHTSWRCRRRRNRQQQKEFSAAQSRRAQCRWAAARNAEPAEPIRLPHPLLTLSVHRPGLDPFAVRIVIADDGLHRRRTVTEDGAPWGRRQTRTTLLHWFSGLLAGAGI